jgi:hypothetical protein
MQAKACSTGLSYRFIKMRDSKYRVRLTQMNFTRIARAFNEHNQVVAAFDSHVVVKADVFRVLCISIQVWDEVFSSGRVSLSSSQAKRFT